MRKYTPRGMPLRFLANAPVMVKERVLDLVRIDPAAPFDYDILFRPSSTDEQVVGLDFSKNGIRGQHFFLNYNESRAYRERKIRDRVKWENLPEEVQNSLLQYLKEE